MEYYADLRYDEIMQFAAMWIVLEGIMLHEINQREQDKCQVISHICVREREREERDNKKIDCIKHDKNPWFGFAKLITTRWEGRME